MSIEVKIIRELNSKRIVGELVYSPYQIAFGVSIRYLECIGGWMFRIYFGQLKLWFNLKGGQKTGEDR